MKIKVGINGMGRIGRMVVRSIVESKNNNLEIKQLIIEQILRLAQIF